MQKFIALSNPRTNQVKEFKTGWSWTCFFFSSFFGIPLFLRKLTVLAIAVIVFDIVYYTMIIAQTIASLQVIADGGGLTTLIALSGVTTVLGFVIFGLAIWLGIKGNRMGIEAHKKQGWVEAAQVTPSQAPTSAPTN